MRLLPRSLFGRLMLVLASGLILAQLLSAAINFAERDSLLARASGLHPAQRIADIVNLLDSFTPAERARIVGLLNAPPMVVSLDRPPVPEDQGGDGGAHEAMFRAVLRAALGDDRPVRVSVLGNAPSWWHGPGLGPGRGARGGQRAGPAGEPMGGPTAGQMGGAMGGPMGMGPLRRPPPEGIAVLIQVQLRDRTWASFDIRFAEESAKLSWRLLATLATLLAAVLLLSYVAVRWVTRPLHALATAADALGRDINRPPLPEAGPLEVSQAARAFNTMQSRLVRFIDERTRLFTAMSHDLKTPLTRMRLRAEMLEDAQSREEFEADVHEMEAMVTQTLEFMRGLTHREPEQNVDLMGLLEGVQADNEAMGRKVTIAGRVDRPYFGAPQFLRRCIGNLVDNATLYGRQADIAIEPGGAELVIRIRDRGPGIPDDELEAVFEPFYRLERSRSRETGGTGLGLGIARNIARAHGGDVHLRNHPEGGLEAILTLPWKRGPAGGAGTAAAATELVRHQ